MGIDAVTPIALTDYHDGQVARGASAKDRGVPEGQADPAGGAPATAQRETSTPEGSAVPGAGSPPLAAASFDVGVVFWVSPDSGELVVKIVDRQTHQVLRQIPPEEVQQFHSMIQKMRGVLLDRKG